MIPARESSLTDAPARGRPAPRLPLSGRSRCGDRPPHLHLVPRSELAADTALELDRRLRALSGRAARCRLVEGCLAAALLSRRGWFSLGFVRLGDYTSERLGLGARIVEEEARVAVCLRRLPQITAAFVEGSLTWTALRLIAGVATGSDERRWIEQANVLDTRALAALVRAAATGNPVAGEPHATGVRSRTAEDNDDDDPQQRWAVRVSHGGRRLWRAACEMASRTAGARLAPAQVLEQVAAEASSGQADGMFERSLEPARSRPPFPPSAPAPAEWTAEPPATKGPAGAGLVELLAAELEQAAGTSASPHLPFLTLEAARELEQRDPQLAAFFADTLADALTGNNKGRSGDVDQPLAPPPPEYGWFEKALRSIGHAEGFAWLQDDLPVIQPSTPPERLEAELRAIDDADPHTIDARLREVRRAAQALDFEMATLLRDAAGHRVYRTFKLTNFEQYVETRLGFSPRTAWSLLSIVRTVHSGCPLLGEAWKSGRISTLAAGVLLPVVGRAKGGSAHTDGQWIERAGIVTLRRLEAEVSWALDRRDELGANRASAGTTSPGDGRAAGAADRGALGDAPGTATGAAIGAATGAAIDAVANRAPDNSDGATRDGATLQAVAPPPLDLDLTGHALAAVTPRELQMRARSGGPDPGAAGDGFGVEIALFAPESVIFLVEHTIHGLRRGFESRGRAFERMVALAMLEWMSTPKHPDPVFERDGWTCAVPGCRSRRNLHDHHVVFRSQGGDNARSNRITVCAAHHLHGLHRGRIRASGQAPHALHWEIGCRFGWNAGTARPLARLIGDRYVDRD